MLKAKFFAALILMTGSACAFVPTYANAVPESVFLCEILRTPEKYDTKIVEVKGFIFGGPHGSMLVSSFDFKRGLPLDLSSMDDQDPAATKALSVGMSSWADAKNPWVYVKATGILQFNKSSKALILKLKTLDDIQYWHQSQQIKGDQRGSKGIKGDGSKGTDQRGSKGTEVIN